MFIVLIRIKCYNALISDLFVCLEILEKSNTQSLAPKKTVSKNNFHQSSTVSIFGGRNNIRIFFSGQSCVDLPYINCIHVGILTEALGKGC